MFRALLRLFGALAVVALLVAADVWSKAWASKELKRAGPVTYLDGRVVLEFRENSGIAFGLLRESLDQRKTTLMLAYSGLVAAGLLSLLSWRVLRGRGAGFANAGIALLLAGTVGNFLDRLDTATVTDFVALRPTAGVSWPAFNIADVCVATGLVLCLLALWRAAFGARFAPSWRA